MAKQTITTLIDDLDGTPADETVTFGIDGKTFEIDLSKVHGTALREGLAPFINAARRAGNRGRVSTTGAAPRRTTDREENERIRDWARANGLRVSDRGRIPDSVLDAYKGRPTTQFPNLSAKNQDRALQVVGSQGWEPPVVPEDEIVKWYRESGRNFPSNYTVGEPANSVMKAAYGRWKKAQEKKAVNA